ncbi:hypothetical protein PGT21_028597 [Puccinia graminis f. sp. tritici]|uniref:Uncharacterized protein n=1 Tax=Puccinia graminis f. sp. tritici TaxID=56615 RepID=A0A5B0QC36_PUCGR|nr:hypothetical protein PGT21_028597 [Puccinia graminis f. sp. tritici]
MVGQNLNLADLSICLLEKNTRNEHDIGLLDPKKDEDDLINKELIILLGRKHEVKSTIKEEEEEPKIPGAAYL